MADKKISALTAATTPLAGTEVLPIVQSSATVKVSVANLTAGRDTTVANAVIYDPGYGYFGVRNSSLAADFANNALAQSSDGLNTVVNAKTGGTVKLRINDTSVVEVATDTTIKTGNIVQGTAAKGFNFTANTPAAGMTSQLLNWYEEGTFTPSVTIGGGTTGIVVQGAAGKYTRVGRVVHAQFYLYFSFTSGSTGNVIFAGLPFTAAAATLDDVGGGFAGENWTGISGAPIFRVIQNTKTLYLGYTGTGAITQMTHANCTNNYCGGAFSFSYVV